MLRWISQLAIVSHSVLFKFARVKSKWSVSENTIIYCCSLPHYSAKQQIHLQCRDHQAYSHCMMRKGKVEDKCNILDIYMKKQNEGWKYRWCEHPFTLTWIWSLKISPDYIMEFSLKSYLKSVAHCEFLSFHYHIIKCISSAKLDQCFRLFG